MKKDLLKIIFLCLISTPVLAAKFDAMMGMFMLDAAGSEGSTSVSSLGSYRAAFAMPVLDHYDLHIDYTLNMANTVGGDLGYGVDLGVNYFPFTFSEAGVFEKDGIRVRRDEFWRPYVGMTFNQRNFQSVKNSFAGFGFDIGTEYSLSKMYSLKFEYRYISLGGSGETEATEMNMLAGISLRI